MDSVSLLPLMISTLKGDQRRIHHALKVHSFSRLIGQLEGLDESEQLTLEVAAIFHDIGIHRCEEKYNSTAGNLQEIEGPPIAKELLKDYEDLVPHLERVLFLIGHHHSYSAIDGRDFQILVEADFLVNMYEDDLSKTQVEALSRKVFKTKAGLSLLSELSIAL